MLSTSRMASTKCTPIGSALFGKLLLLTLLLLQSSPVVLSSEVDESSDEEVQKLCFGIDLGTTFSTVSLDYNNNREVILNKLGNRMTPSIVGLGKAGEILVGEESNFLANTNPKQLIRTIKRIIGRSYDDPAVQKEKERVQHEIVEGENGMAVVKLGDKTYTPQEISAEILKRLMINAYNHVKTLGEGKEVGGVVITVPAYFANNERQATAQAAALAGIDLKNLISEPVAAAIVNKKQEVNETKLVIDIGGGTTDVTIVEIEDGIYATKSTSGDAHLGGVDFDKIIMDIMKESAKAKNLTFDSTFDLQQYSEELKIQLSSSQLVEFKLPDGSIDSITLAKFNKKIQPMMKRVVSLVHEALNKIKMESSEINSILLVGGSSRIPLLSEMINREFNIPPVISDEPDYAVGLGAAMIAAIDCKHSDADTILINNIPFGLGVKAMQNSQPVTAFIIEHSTVVPTKQTKTFSTAFDNQPAVLVEILQGFSVDVDQNIRIGTIEYENLPRMRAGKVQVEVEFHITEDQTVTARVKGLFEGAETKETIIALNASKISDADIEKQKKRAEHDRLVMDAILELEDKWKKVSYYINSDITKSGLDSAHVSFISETLQTWQDMKGTLRAKQDATTEDIEKFKEEFNALYSKAESVVQIIEETGDKLISAYDEKDQSATSHSQQTQATQSAEVSPDL